MTMIYHHSNPSDRWDNKEKKMDAVDMGEEPEKEKVDVVTEDKEEHEHDIPFSGMFCCICRDHATFIFEGDSLCWKHYDEKLAEILKKHKNGNS